MRKMRLTVSTALVALVTVMACGDEGGLDFPNLSQQLIDGFCIRGNATTGQTKTGSIADTDCDAADVDPTYQGYYEVYIVKVGSAASVTFTVTSNFDPTLTLLSLDSYTSSTASLTELDFNDDTNGFDPVLTFTLQPDTDYVIAIAGYDYTEFGNYTLTIN